MDIERLSSRDATVVREYVKKKFKEFNGAFYPKAIRKKKCIAYFLAAEGTANGQQVIKEQYSSIFKESFPEEDARGSKASRERERHFVPSQEGHEMLRTQLARTELTLGQLHIWKQQQEYQMGEDFLLQLRQAVEPLERGIFSETSFETEYQAKLRSKMTTVTESTSSSRSASFEAMFGIEQHAGITFEATSVNWGTVNAKLEQAFKAGAWANGSARVEMTRLGFNAEAQLAVAIGAQLTIDAECRWKKGDLGIELAGGGECFLGARAGIGGKLSVDALKGISASIEAGAFAGFKAEARGSCSFTYGDRTLVGLGASAAVTFGAGADFSAKLEAPIFGPTVIEFSANLTLGLGTETATQIAIDFNEIYLAGSEQFLKVVYLPTLMKGYKMELMSSDARNLHYLDKCITRMGGKMEGLQKAIDKYDRTPEEKRGLLAEI